MQSFRSFEQAVFTRVVNECATIRKRLSDAELKREEGAGDNPRRNEAPQPQAVADAMVSVMEDETMTYPQFRKLEEVVDR